MTSWDEIGSALNQQGATQADYARRQQEEQRRGQQRHAEAQGAVQQFLGIMRGARRPRMPGSVSFDVLRGMACSQLQDMFKGQQVWQDANEYIFVSTSGVWCVREYGDHSYPITASSSGDTMSEKDLVALKMMLGATLRANNLPLPRD